MRYILILISIFVITRYLLEKRKIDSLAGQSVGPMKLWILSKPQLSSGKYVYDSGFYRIYFPEENQIEIGDYLYLEFESGRPQAGVTEKKRYKKTLIVQSIYHLHQTKDSGISTMSIFLKFLGKIQSKSEEIFVSSLPFPHAELVQGILTGKRLESDQESIESLKILGMTHIVSASGYNIQVIELAILHFFRIFRLKRKISLVLLSFFLVSYTILAGFTASIIRATLSTLLRTSGALAGRQSSGIHHLWIASLIMLLIQPAYLENLGFQLSVISSFALLSSSRSVELSRYFDNKRDALSEILEVFRESWSSTIRVWFFTAPILLWYFGSIPLIGLIANTVLLWQIPWILWASIGMMTVKLIELPIFAWFFPLARSIAWIFSDVFLRLSVWFGNIPLSLPVFEGKIRTCIVLIWSVMVILTIFHEKRRKSMRKLLRKA
jgi:ComEC/Rec2-related protein